LCNDFKYKFQLKPIYEVAYVRPNSQNVIRVTKEMIYIMLPDNIQRIQREHHFKIEREKEIILQEVERKRNF
jgi:hypothetical protein